MFVTGRKQAWSTTINTTTTVHALQYVPAHILRVYQYVYCIYVQAHMHTPYSEFMQKKTRRDTHCHSFCCLPRAVACRTKAPSLYLVTPPLWLFSQLQAAAAGSKEQQQHRRGRNGGWRRSRGSVQRRRRWCEVVFVPPAWGGGVIAIIYWGFLFTGTGRFTSIVSALLRTYATSHAHSLRPPPHANRSLPSYVYLVPGRS